MSNGPMDKSTAVGLGPFIQAVFDQFTNSPELVNPLAIANLPAGYTLERTIQMSDFIIEPLGGVHSRVRLSWAVTASRSL